MSEFKYDVPVGGRVGTIEASIGRINFDDLRGEVSECSATALWYGVLHATAGAELERAKLSHEVLKAQLGQEIRANCIAAAKKYTERSIEEDVLQDKRFQASSEQVTKASETYQMLWAAKDATAMKARTLQSMAGMVGQELAARRDPLRDDMRSHLEKEPSKTPV